MTVSGSSKSKSIILSMVSPTIGNTLEPMPSSRSSVEGPHSGTLCLLSLHRIPGDSKDSASYVRSILERFEADDWLVESRNLTLEFEVDPKDPIHPTFRSMLIERLIPQLDHDVLLIVDDFFELDPAWFHNAVELLTSGQADLVVASRNSRDWFGKLAAIGVERLTGCRAVNASALAVRTRAIGERHASIKPAGQWISLEFQLRIPSERCAVLDSQELQKPVKSPVQRLGITELSFLKSYVDHKFGNFSRLVQFCSVGFSGMFIDLTTYAGFQTIFRKTNFIDIRVPIVNSTADLALAGFLAIWLAITWNFILNRRLTFNDSRRNSTFLRQYATYILSNALALCVSFLIRLWLPANFEFFDKHKLVAAFVGIVIATGISFNMTRYFVFAARNRAE
jgi:dolichol-phosphate mannosyltransferase